MNRVDEPAAILTTSLGVITLSRAKPDELNDVMGILEDASAWLVSRGIDQWPSPFPAEEYPAMARRLAQGEVYLARLSTDGSAVGTLYLKWKDTPLWYDESEVAAYVHSFAIHRRVRGFGIGAALLEWAKDYARRRGKLFLRLDCVADNPRLNRYYASLGFRYCGIATDGNYVASLYEVAL